MPSRAEAEVFIVELVRARFARARTVQLKPDTNLITSGIVDSFSFMDLVAEIEKKFGITLDLYDFERLTTLGGLCDAVATGS
jgi:acyl carrier protein